MMAGVGIKNQPYQTTLVEMQKRINELESGIEELESGLDRRRHRSSDMQLPWPPSKNAIWRCYNNRVILSTRGRQYHAQMRGLSHAWGKRFEGPVRVELDFYPPTRRRWDLDGRIPVLLDAIVRQGILRDDDQVVELHARKHQKQERVGVWIKILPVSPLSDSAGDGDPNGSDT